MENLGLNLDDKRSRQELEEIAEAFNNLARYASLKSVLAPLERDPTKKIADMFDEHLTGAYERLPEWAKWRKESESSDTHTGEHDENL